MNDCASKSSACGRFIHSFNRSSSVSFRRLHFTTSSLFHIVHSTSLSTPQEKPCLCSTSQIPLIPFRALVIYLFNSFQNCISKLYSYPKLAICLPIFPANSSNPSIPSTRFVSFHKVIAFPFPCPQFYKCFISPAVLLTP